MTEAMRHLIPSAPSPTTGGVVIQRRPTILLLLISASLINLIMGCATLNDRAKIAPYRPSYVHPAMVTPVNNEPAREAAREELGPEVAAEIPKVDREPPQPVETGAAALVQSMANALRDRVMDEEGLTRIAIQLRNQSRCGTGEFNAMRERLALELNRAADDARGARLSFAIESDANDATPPHYYIQGSAYLISAGGFDLWELFLSMTPASESLAIWNSPRPVRVLRTPRPSQPQIVAW
jgi:hypothetical protein